MKKWLGMNRQQAGFGLKVVALLITTGLVFSCSPNTKAEEELRAEVKEIRKELKGMQEKIDKMEAAQQVMLTVLKHPTPTPTPPGAAALAPQAAPPMQMPATPPPLTVGQLLANKEQYLGTRITVKGEAGPVLVHHKSLMLKSPQGMVEVFFGKLPDAKVVQRLTSIPIDQSLTVTGMVGMPPGAGGGAKLQITAEAIDF